MGTNTKTEIEVINNTEGDTDMVVNISCTNWVISKMENNARLN